MVTTRGSASAPRRWRLFAGALALGIVAMTVRFAGGYRLHTPVGTSWGVADDVYISANFARTFAEGHGLVWFEGAPKVEGFTNPLWVAILAVVHLIPGYDEDHLGVYVATINGVLVAWMAVVLVRSVGVATGARTVSMTRVVVAVALSCACCTILCFCAGMGFETAAVAVFSMMAFHESLANAESMRLRRIAVLVGLAFWTRMDGALTCLPAVYMVMSKRPDRRRLWTAVATLAALVSSQFLLRRWYYAEWLPNTFFLKGTGWRAADRLSQGLFFNAVPICFFVIVAIPGWLFLRRTLDRAAVPAAAALLTYFATLLYSVNNGGDLVFAFAHDRFSAVGTVFLAFGISCGVVMFRSRALGKVLALIAGLALATGPMWLLSPRESFATLIRFLDLRRHPMPQDRIKLWIHQGKQLQQFTFPGARVALCGAGALVYFSHRGGVDLLGKIEPLVAHLVVPEVPPPEARCWRGFPGAGHNKEDVPAVFDARRPELSLHDPPEAHRERYVRIAYEDFELFALKSSRYVDWDKVRVLSGR
jgi:hypothetical protein